MSEGCLVGVWRFILILHWPQNSSSIRVVVQINVTKRGKSPKTRLISIVSKPIKVVVMVVDIVVVVFVKKN